MLRKVIASVVLVWLATGCTELSRNPPNPDSSLFNPPTFTSSNHLLDLLVIAEPATITLGPFKPTAWVFKICETAVAHGDDCPADTRTVAPYGGIRLQLSPGDHLRMRLINRLPAAPADAENAHGSDPMMNAMLAANPVNIHTHGLIVEPRNADAADPTYGDYVYVLGYPAGEMPAMVHPDETATDKPIQYDIYIPSNHPSGLYWFHPHVHGLGVNQLSEGLSGIITVGSPSDYLDVPSPIPPVRYVVLKDVQILPNGDARDQEDANFCTPTALVGVQRNGECEGRDTSVLSDVRRQEGSGGNNYVGGLWYFTVNGQAYPEFAMQQGSGEIWRLLNAGASRSYDLVVEDDQTKAPIPFQVLSLDGVALAPPAGLTVAQVKAATGGKVDVVDCGSGQSNGSGTQPVCATHLVMLPSARAEIWVGSPANSATLLTRLVYTGAAGDTWPEANIAHITPSSGSTSAARAGLLAPGTRLLKVRSVPKGMLSAQGVLGAPVMANFAGVAAPLSLHEAQQIASAGQAGQPKPAESSSELPGGGLSPQQIANLRTRMAEFSKPVASLASPNCSALPAGHRRRIFFGNPTAAPDSFGLGYEEVDSDGNAVPGTFQDIASYDPSQVNVCLPLGAGNMPVNEEWELVNVAGETHNFHMHQTKFYVLPQDAPDGDGGVLMDNIPLPNGGAACDGTVVTWRAGTCSVPTVVVKIPFAEVGDFVYHCHIGEHQDGGMMAHIRVIASQ